MITYEANLNCDGQDCEAEPVTSLRPSPGSAKRLAEHEATQKEWVIIEDEHYCPDCAEIVIPLKGANVTARSKGKHQKKRGQKGLKINNGRTP